MRTGSLTVVTAGADGASRRSVTINASRDWIIGRSPEADIFVDDALVSRQHLVVGRTPDGWIVRDVSTNGSWHAGVRIPGSGLAVPAAGDLRVTLGKPAGPVVIITGEDPAVAPTVAPTPLVLGRPDGFGSPGPQPNWTGAVGGPAKRTSRRRRRIAVTLVVLAIVLLITDRVAAHVASTQAVSRIVQQSEGLGSNPSVSFGGFPFLTQVAFGKYTDITVGIDGVVAATGSPRIEHITGHLRGARIPLSKAIHDDVSTIPVDRVTATVSMRFSDLNAYLKDQPGHLVLAASGDRLQITGSVELLGQTVAVSGTGRVGVDADGLTVSPTEVHVAGGGGVDLPGDLGLGTDESLFPPVPVPLPSLPFNLRLTGVHVHSDGLDVSAAADHVVLDARQK